MLCRTYIDDSSDEQRVCAVAAGAFMGTYAQFNALQKRWRKRLKKDGLRYFRTTEYFSLRGEFDRFRDPVKYPKPKGSEAAKSVLLDLENIIHECEVMGVAVCIPMDMYNDLRANEPHGTTILPEDAFEAALQSLLKMCTEISRDNLQSPIAFVCDDSSASARITKLYSEFKEANPDLAGYMTSLVHNDDKLLPSLQAADLMAHLARHRFMRWLTDPDRAIHIAEQAMRERLKRLNVHHIGAWDRAYALRILEHERKRRGLIA